ncbi:MAG: hypothetical protein JXO22_16910, partial [Phycisphaerae bacterium]|nr:hypothetical protein [Phycisphaerae bacterium]
MLIPWKLEPTILNFGQVARDAESVTKTVMIKRGDGGPLNPELVTPSRDGLSAKLTEIQPGEQYELEVTLTPPWPNGTLSTAVLLKTGLKDIVQESVRVFARIEA